MNMTGRFARRAAITVASAATVAWLPKLATADCPGDNPRLQVRVYQYSGASDASAKGRFEVFRRLIGTQLEDIATAYRDQSGEISYVTKLKIDPPPNAPAHEDRFKDVEEVSSFWRLECYLELLRGHVIYIKDSDTLDVSTSIYLGQSADRNSWQKVDVRFPVQAAAVPVARFAYQFVTYYALAMDAKLTHRGTAYRTLMSKALEAEKSIDLRPKQEQDQLLTDSLQDMRKAFDQEVATLIKEAKR